jgi:hypothetical protein
VKPEFFIPGDRINRDDPDQVQEARYQGFTISQRGILGRPKPCPYCTGREGEDCGTCGGLGFYIDWGANDVL